MLSPRERVLCALNHEEPDRVPVFFGASGATAMLVPAYERFQRVRVIFLREEGVVK